MTGVYALASAPLRLSIAGGGSDLPRVWQHGGGELLTVALDERVILSVTLRDDMCFRLRWNEEENWSVATKISSQNSLITSALRALSPHGADITINTPITPGAGLGGSGAFCVALCTALLSLNQQHLNLLELSKLAMTIENNVFGDVVGIQDPAAAAFGCLIRIRINQTGDVSVTEENQLADCFRNHIAPGLRLVDTQIRRKANNSLTAFNRSTSSTNITDHINSLKRQLQPFEKAIMDGDLTTYGLLLREHWQKKRLLPHVNHSEIDKIEKIAYKSGCLGGKLVGAGGGGYFLVAGDDYALGRLEQAMSIYKKNVRNVIPAKSGVECSILEQDNNK